MDLFLLLSKGEELVSAIFKGEDWFWQVSGWEGLVSAGFVWEGLVSDGFGSFRFLVTIIRSTKLAVFSKFSLRLMIPPGATDLTGYPACILKC